MTEAGQRGGPKQEEESLVKKVVTVRSRVAAAAPAPATPPACSPASTPHPHEKQRASSGLPRPRRVSARPAHCRGQRHRPPAPTCPTAAAAGLHICGHLDRAVRLRHHVQQVPAGVPRLPLPHHPHHVVRRSRAPWAAAEGWAAAAHGRIARRRSPAPCPPGPPSHRLAPQSSHTLLQICPLAPLLTSTPPLSLPLTRTCATPRRHMFFCAALAIGLVKSGKVQAISMDRETYVK